MSQPHHRHKGFHPYKMDTKFRVSIPTAWRPEDDGSLFLLYSKRHDMPLVKVRSQAAFDNKVQLIHDSDKTPAEKDQLLGRLAMLSSEVKLNDQGKLTLPRELCLKTGIAADSTIYLAGRGSQFEIWSNENFDRMLEIESGPLQDDDLGIF
jgi:DNA-binding transcriptional regulator/RsmH inhibitor MraZ